MVNSLDRFGGVYLLPVALALVALVLIGIGGCGEGNGAEFYQGAVDDDPQAWTDASFMITNDGSLLVTGSSAIPRTLNDYGAGGLAYLNSVGPGVLDPGATQLVHSASSAGPTVVSDALQVLCSTTFTPSYPATIVAQVAYDANETSTPFGATTTMQVEQSGGGGAGTLSNSRNVVHGTRSTQVLQVEFAVNAGVSVTVVVRGVAPPTVSATWWDVTLRVQELR